jgi:predicted ester cyclase
MADPRQVSAENIAAFNAHDERRIRATYADNAVGEAPGAARLEGADAIVEYVMVWLRAFPDARLQVVHELVVGDSVVQEITMSGTHTGPLTTPEGDIPPTNRKTTGRGMGIQRIENGKIVEERLYFDQLEILTQLGLVPEPATA